MQRTRDEVPRRRRRQRQQTRRIHFRRLASVPRDHRLVVRAVDEHVERRADPSASRRQHRLLLRQHQPLIPLLFHRFVELAGDSRRRRLGLVRERERPDRVKAELADKLGQLLKVRLRLAGESDDERRADRDVGDALAQFGEQCFRLFGV